MHCEKQFISLGDASHAHVEHGNEKMVRIKPALYELKSKIGL
jgi:hypothetical protein